jgi:hypothetical protein
MLPNFPFCGIEIITVPYPTIKIQAKTHRKRRINKKWLKRYGYKTILAKYDHNKIIFDERNRVAYCYPHQVDLIYHVIK